MKKLMLILAFAAFLLAGFQTESFATTATGYAVVINDDDPPKDTKAVTKDTKTAGCKDTKAKDAKSCCPSSKNSCAKSCAGNTSCSKDKKPEKK